MLLKYLKPNVVIEPLVHNWYAWIHLLSPMTAGLHFKKRYMRLLESFIEHKELHQQSSRDPNLMGGFFVNLTDEQFERARSHLKAMAIELQALFDLSDSISKLDQFVCNEKGSSLEPLYQIVPENLRGSVELLYDFNNQPSVRYLEAILYQRFYDESHQGFIFSIFDDENTRPFASSTPRFSDECSFEVKLPFSSSVFDEIIRSRALGINLDLIFDKLQLPKRSADKFSEYFTDEPPVVTKDRNFLREGVRVRYFGHACVLLQTKETSILIDPFIRNAKAQGDSYCYLDLPDSIDAVLITHAHQDHLVLETLLQLRGKIKKIFIPRNNGGFVSDPSIKLMLKHLGFQEIYCLDEFDSAAVGDFEILAIPFLGEHGDLNIQSKLAYCLKSNQRSFLFAVDSNNLDSQLYDRLREMIGPVEVAFIGMECKGAPYSWTYGPLSPEKIPHQYDQSRRLSGSNSDKAWKIIKSLGVRECHVYAMGLEPWFSYLLGVSNNPQSLPILESDRLIAKCQQQNIVSSRLFLKAEFLYSKPD